MALTLGALSGLLLAVLPSSEASAVQITNTDAASVILVVLDGPMPREITLKPSEIAPKACENSCLLRLGTGPDDAYAVEADQAVSIEDGVLYFDQPQSQSPMLP